MTPEQQFWWNWGVSALAGAATFAAVLVALFSDWLRAKFLPPKLIIKLADRTADKLDSKWEHKQEAGDLQSRWCHVRVANTRRMSPATEVQVFLLRVEEPNAAGNFQVRWSSEVPLRWRHPEFKPSSFTVGSAREADLLSVAEGIRGGRPWLQLWPTYAPSGLRYKWDESCRLTLIVQARGVEADSNKLRVVVHWDGEWSDDPHKMSRHLTIESWWA